MIPAHLAVYPWYAPHQAWLRGCGLPHHDPGEVVPAHANRAGADLAGAYLADANLAGAYLAGAYLAGAYLADANLAGAYLAHADLARADLTEADLTGADLAGADLAGADLTGAVLPWEQPTEEEAISGAVAAIAAAPHLWRQSTWHEVPYDPSTAAEVGACGSAHCLAGHMQALLPLGHPLRRVSAHSAGWVLAPRAARAGWFGATVHPDLQALVNAARVGGGR